MNSYTITTQTLENYGAHADSGKFSAGENFWKFKSGMTYIISGIDRLQDAVAFAVSILTENNILIKEFITDFKDGDDRKSVDGYVELNVHEYMNADRITRYRMRSNVIWD